LGNLLTLTNIYRLLTKQSRKTQILCYNQSQYDKFIQPAQAKAPNLPNLSWRSGAWRLMKEINANPKAFHPGRLFLFSEEVDIQPKPILTRT